MRGFLARIFPWFGLGRGSSSFGLGIPPSDAAPVVVVQPVFSQELAGELGTWTESTGELSTWVGLRGELCTWTDLRS